MYFVLYLVAKQPILHEYNCDMVEVGTNYKSRRPGYQVSLYDKAHLGL